MSSITAVDNNSCSTNLTTTTTTITTYICEVCGYVIENLDNFKIHLKGHSIIGIKSELVEQQNVLVKESTACDSEVETINDNISGKLNLKSAKLECKNEELNIFPKGDTSTLICVDENISQYCNSPLSASLTAINNGEPPYRYSDDANIYICNLCECTYDSLRSMKAHLWKHSGHHNLSYPIHDAVFSLNNKEEPIEMMKLESVPLTSDEIVAANEVVITTSVDESPNSPIETSLSSTNASSLSSNTCNTSPNNRQSGGICSVLLEVIEQLRHEECTSTNENEKNVETKNEQKKKKKIKTKSIVQLDDNEIKGNEHIESLNKNKNLKNFDEYKLNIKQRGRKRKLNELILENDEKLKQEKEINNNKNKIEITANEKLNTKMKSQQLNYMCIKCKCLFRIKNSLEIHKQNNCNKLDDTTVNNADVEIIYACDSCDFKCLIQENLIDHVLKFHEKSLKTNDILANKIDGFKQNNNKNINLFNNRKYTTQTLPQSSNASSVILNNSNLITNATNSNSKFISLLISLATNDGYEQYVCGLCPYVCYHLPSLKSHMWTHVTNRKFDYSLNTTIINAALDYENRLNRQLLTYTLNNKNEDSDGSTGSNSSNSSFSELTNPYELINYPLNNKITSSSSSNSSTNSTNLNLNNCDKPMVSFRCSKCGYSTINLSLLRLHKRQHYIKIIASNSSATKFQVSKINDKETQQKVLINS